MRNREALELLYRRPCDKSGPNPECMNCELGKASKCSVHEAYLQIIDALEILDILKNNMFLHGSVVNESEIKKDGYQLEMQYYNKNFIKIDRWFENYDKKTSSK